jgi:hypothetical protein
MLENIIFSSINYEHSPLVNAIELYAITLEEGLICQLLVITSNYPHWLEGDK